MNKKIINCKKISKEIYKKLKSRINKLIKLKKKPCLAVILIGNNKSSIIYINNKIKACKKNKIKFIIKKFNKKVNEKEIILQIKNFNKDKKINGILIQLPIPKHINKQKLFNKIDPRKDVDGFHPKNIGMLFYKKPTFIPCTPYGIIKILKYINYPIMGSNIVIVNSSNIIGKPQAIILLKLGATVTICHSKTNNLTQYTKKADILISGIGKRNIIKTDMIKKNSVIIDVGINHNENGKICGDIEINNIKNIKYITPVPGGVGKMTITMLLLNTVKAAEIQAKII